ncbi:MAG: enoyl-CoA hydratase/isomerase family protein, partial [Actinomycetia bacterium]|nr:enoyl-CoA hydratase/isomerase family protein [Actinomycetes bacterium]
MPEMPDPEPIHIRVSVENHVGWLEFDRGPVNALDWVMVRQVIRALDDLETDHDVRVICIASALDRYFSAGADL